MSLEYFKEGKFYILPINQNSGLVKYNPDESARGVYIGRIDGEHCFIGVNYVGEYGKFAYNGNIKNAIPTTEKLFCHSIRKRYR